MSKTKKLYRNLENIVESTMAEMIDQIIMKIGKQYVLFNRYSITRHDGYVTVFRRSDASELEFTEIKHAMAWIMLDKYNRYTERDRLYRLDHNLSSVKVNQAIHTCLKLKHSKDSEMRSIYDMKLQIDREREKRIVAERDKYIIMANRYHLQGTKK